MLLGAGADTMGAMERMGWDALVFEVPGEVADEVIGRLAPHTQGAESLDGAGGLVTVRLYLGCHGDAGAAAQRDAVAILEQSGLDAGACGLRTERVEDGRWVERYQASLRPFALGSRFIVHPDGRSRSARERTPLLLVPGRAFGTGEHATTQLCSELLERRVTHGSRWLDLGCGTAILSMVAHHCGAGEVLAVDVDPEAIAAAREVLEANRLGEDIALREGQIHELPDDAWSGVVANISAAVLERLGDPIASRLEPQGLLIASGFLDSQEPELSRALGAAGLLVIERAVRAPWAALVLRRG